MTRKITNLVKDGNRFTFNHMLIYSTDDWGFDPDNPIVIKSYMTNNDGRGLFELDNYYHQYIGTCDFSCAGKSKGAARKYINRYFGIVNYKGENISHIYEIGL